MTSSAGRQLHPRHGIHDPTTGTPARAAGSLRRTTTVDLLRPGGPGGAVIIDGRGRDLVTRSDGEPAVIADARLRAEVDYPHNCRLIAIETEPRVSGTGQLLGATVGPGFRAKVGAAVPDAAGERSLTHLLLDDMPGAVLVSGYALQESRGGIDMPPREARAFTAGRADLCSGFRRGGTMLAELDLTGRMPMPTGPVAPTLEAADDQLAWHDHERLPAGAIRRRRRLDLRGTADGLSVDAMFRDSYVDGSGLETVIHEYTLDALIDPARLQVLTIEAVPRVLPWIECPVAAASAGSLVGQTVSDLRTWVRRQLSGILTCTHLNDLLRSLTDVDQLVLELEQGR